MSEHEALDAALRAAAFAYLDDAVRRLGDVLPWRIFADEFRFRGQKVILASQRGIHKPRQLDAAMTVMTTYPRPDQPPPYEDAFDQDDATISYAYQGQDPEAYDNAALRACYQRGLPIIYLFGISKGYYMPVYPVFVVGDDPDTRRFEISFSPASRRVVDRGSIVIGEGHAIQLVDASEAVRRYQPQLVHRRLHQAGFRQRVLRAYQHRCAVCRLNRAELIEAAHIVPDRDPRGIPATTNGLALCRLHHAAYDHDLMGIRPDLVIELRPEILRGRDGPMYEAGLRAWHGERLRVLPRRTAERPDVEKLEERYARFKDSA